jgi:hypothetical protein
MAIITSIEKCRLSDGAFWIIAKNENLDNPDNGTNKHRSFDNN